MHVKELSTRIVVSPPNELPRELVSEFLLSCQRQLADVKLELAKQVFEPARLFGHQLKGTGSPYGFPRLTEIGAAIEQAAVRKNVIELEAHVHNMEAYLIRVELL